jgi:S1-C subfamily serine protease
MSKKNILKSLLLAVAFVVSTIPVYGDSYQPLEKSIMEKMIKSTVQVGIFTSKKPFTDKGASVKLEILATGAFISPDGLVVTNKHVTENIKKYEKKKLFVKIAIKLYNSESTWVECKVVKEGANTDAAFLTPGKSVKPPDYLFTTQNVTLGEQLYTFGHPYNHFNTFNTGFVVEFAKAKEDNKDPFISVTGKENIKEILMNIRLAPGSSGSPVVNIKGELVGIIEAVTYPTDFNFYTYIVPSKCILKELEGLKL